MGLANITGEYLYIGAVVVVIAVVIRRAGDATALGGRRADEIHRRIVVHLAAFVRRHPRPKLLQHRIRTGRRQGRDFLPGFPAVVRSDRGACKLDAGKVRGILGNIVDGGQTARSVAA